MTDQTVANTMSPADFSTVVDVVKSTLTTGDTGVKLTGLGLDSATLQKSVADAVESALSISLFDALLKGWYGAKSIAALIGKKGPMDGKPRVAALATHKLKISHVPQIKVQIAQVADIKTIALPVTLEVEAAGVALTVVDRKITKAAVGYLQPKLTIKVEKVKVVETKLKRIDLSDSISLDRIKPPELAEA